MIDTAGLATNVREFPLPPVNDIILNVGTAIVGIIGLSAALEGFFRTKINSIARIILFAGAIFTVVPGLMSDIIGLSVIAVIYSLNFLTHNREKEEYI